MMEVAQRRKSEKSPFALLTSANSVSSLFIEAALTQRQQRTSELTEKAKERPLKIV
jgi:hypothetical protein